MLHKTSLTKLKQNFTKKGSSTLCSPSSSTFGAGNYCRFLRCPPTSVIITQAIPPKKSSQFFPFPCLQTSWTNYRSQEAVGLFTQHSAALVCTMGSQMWSCKESLPASHTKHADARDLNTGKELTPGRTALDTWTGKYPFNRSQKLQHCWCLFF